jgi:translocation and assembly module TamB
MKNEEILALLLFNQGIGELSYNQNSQVRSLSSQMLRGNQLGIIDKIRDKLNIDSLEVVETQDISSGEVEQSIRLGKQMKNVKIYIDQDLSEKSRSRMTVRFNVTNEFGVEAKIGTGGSSGAGIQWLKRY